VTATPAEETLAAERHRRVRAAVAAIGAGVLTLGGATLFGYATCDRPQSLITFVESLQAQLRGAPPPGFKARQVLFYDEQGLLLVVVAAMLALASVGMGVALVHLYHSAKARRPELPRAVRIAAIAGGGLGVAGLVQAIALAVKANQFADASDQGAEAARDALVFPLLIVILRDVGLFALGLAFVVIALNAMRVGLLTRFMGVLGIIVGVLFIVPLGSSDIVQSFWLIAIGMLFLGRWPGGPPPAWVTGEAQPWPTQQEIRDAKLARRGQTAAPRLTKDRKADPANANADAKADAVKADPVPAKAPPQRRRQRAEPPETPAPEAPARKPHSSSKKRKRPRR